MSAERSVTTRDFSGVGKKKVRWTKDKINHWLKTKNYYGELIDDEWVSRKHMHKWRCIFEHEFRRTKNTIDATKIFCPRCAPSYNKQEYTRFIFESLFGEEFRLTRYLDWLISQSGNQLELDGFCDDLKLAFEYDGEQHSKPRRHWQNNPKLEERKKTDRLKDKLCRDNGITLIRVGHEIRLEDIEDYVIGELRERGFGDKINFPVDCSKYNPATDYELLEEAKKHAEKHDGECRTKYITSASQPVIFYCPKHDREWEVKLTTIRARPNQWCQKCGHRKRVDGHFEKMKGENPLIELVAQFPGYECLSTEFEKPETEYQWKCPKGHEFDLSYKKVKAALKRDQRHFCRVCNKKVRIIIDDMHEHAERHGGKCETPHLQERNPGATPVWFSCGDPNHKKDYFMHRAREVKNNRDLWCPRCPGGKIAKHDLQFVKDLCEKNNFKLLSEKYENNTAPMKISCMKCPHEGEKHLRWMQNNDGKGWCDFCHIEGSEAQE